MQHLQPTVYLVDDDEDVGRALALLLKMEGLPVQRFQSAEAFLEACPADALGCLVLDLRMPQMDGLGLQQALAEQRLQLPVVFISGAGDVAAATRAFRGGAVDFFEKPVDVEAFVKRVKDCLQTQLQQREETCQREQARAEYDRLTAREKEVLALTVAGRSNKEIGRELGISYRTVELHRSHLMTKLGVNSLSGLISKIWGCTESCHYGPSGLNCRAAPDCPSPANRQTEPSDPSPM
jgi:FixJ family two-component response regulator